MVPVSDFLPTLRMLVDVPVPGLMEMAIVKAAQRFCRESKVIVKTRQFDEVFDCQSVSVIGIGTPQLKGAGIVSVASKDHLLLAGYDYTVVDRGEIKFTGNFSDVAIIGVVEPAINADQLPKVLLHDYVDGICAGAANLLQLQPTTAWFNPDLAQYNHREFVQAIRDASRYALENTPALEVNNQTRKREYI
ncbi:hypothetical protein C0W59_19180 [Photobacterium kishitanii]|uniref:hypothetical protein n=1 Tax=Photobacterium kishitanii TaxID=318456 RepID=UPI000D175519|nr:hypothetical protein [Photobacterium kishitanii]PSV11658.1 hypothetical protein C0W59_19180 [Photobacterium kishitanii]